MAPARSSIGYPWILDSIRKYNGEPFVLKAAPAQVVEFLKMPERTKECQYPGAVVHISDRQYYIRAIITKEAQETMEREDEHFTLAHIKNKMVILKKVTLSFAAEEDLRCCEFFLTIEHFCILPMEIDTVDLLNCNVEPGVLKRIKELWQMYMTELQKKDSMSDMNSSDISLTQLLMIASEEKLGELKSLAEQCLDLNSYATQDISPQARTLWSTEIRNNKRNDHTFSIPINLLLIPPEEEAALEQMSEFRPDVNSASDADISSEDLDHDGSDSSQQYNSAVSTLSQEPMEDAFYGQPGNPWNNLPSICVSGSIGSVASDPFITQQNNEKDPATDSDSTPDIPHYHHDKSLSGSSESQDETTPLKPSKLLSHQIQSEAKISPSTNQTRASSSDSDLLSSQRRLSDCSQSLLSLIPLVQGSSGQIHTSPQRKAALESKVPLSPISTYGSGNNRDYKIIRNIFPANGRRHIETCHSPREWKAMKRKQAPEDLDPIRSDQEQQAAVHPERPDCAAAVMSSESTAINGTQTETDSSTEERAKTTNYTCMYKKQTRREQVNKTASTDIAVACATTPIRKKTLPHKPCLEFVTKPTMKAPENSENALPAADLPTTSSKDPSSVSHGQTSVFQAPVLEMKKTKMTHYDGKPFQYKYKPPSADLCTRVNAVRMPADLHQWAVTILSEAKKTHP
ncbi:PREDICTED: adrenocortical dysplasia protein homolog [Nanorana parkeri]|uniref:adrenocortical dysplasia protein homolog n=1 Tax=Nanorana parkeri TaxID=125878 RepID=UPI00085485DE|nr:PREDICTED: adrenocortical dysplasia protein homolog [Nanorana parkeri]